MVSVTGHGLNVLIAASDYGTHGEWAAFACWYSVNRQFPEANVFLALPKSRSPAVSFRWVRRAPVARIRFSPGGDSMPLAAAAALVSNVPLPLLVVADHVMAVRDAASWPDVTTGASRDGAAWLLGDGGGLVKLYAGSAPAIDLCAPAESNEATPFVSVARCGHYDKKSWAEKTAIAPFYRAGRLRRPGMSANEAKVLDLWEQMQGTFMMMSR